ncbi:MAG: sporulation protein [Thermoplasmata archaeon]|nr:MAG: sporulation protein [Thermoplasmata archaeon]
MGILGKMKDAVTGGAAKVSIEYPSEPLNPGDSLHVKVTVMSSGGEFKSKGIYVDLVGQEKGSVVGGSKCDKCGQYDSTTRVNVNKKTFNQSYPLGGAMTLQKGETKVFEGDIQIPPNAQPSYQGSISHKWSIRGRIEAFGNDPDSGFQTIVVK